MHLATTENFGNQDQIKKHFRELNHVFQSRLKNIYFRTKIKYECLICHLFSYHKRF